MRARLWVATVVVLVACGGDDFAVEGSPGQPVAADFSDLTPTIGVRVDGAAAKPFLCDTGSPDTVLDATAFSSLMDGKHSSSLGAFGVTIPGFQTVSYDVFGDDTAGILGGDLLGHFAFTLDYHGARAWVTRAYDAAVRPADVDVGADIALPFRLAGGGPSTIPGDCGAPCPTVRLGATRVLVQATFEGRASPVWAVVDSGSSLIVLGDDLYAALGDGGRPKLEGGTVSTVAADLPSTVTRVWRVRIQGASGAAQASVDDVPAVVVPGWQALPSLAQETGVPVVALIGGAALRYHLTTFDYPGRVLHLAPYHDLSHIHADEWVGVGFTYILRQGDWVIDEVFLHHDAYDKGVRPEDILEEVAGMAVRGQPVEVVDDAFHAFGLGDAVPISYRHLGALQTASVKVEDLLPHYPAP